MTGYSKPARLAPVPHMSHLPGSRRSVLVGGEHHHKMNDDVLLLFPSREIDVL